MREERRSVLVVDDDLATRELFRMALRMAGFEVETAADGVAALRQIEQRVPDVVVLDLDLPGVNGIAVHGELDAEPRTRHVPIVVVTGTDWRSPYPTSAMLSKPTSPHELVDAVRAASRRPDREADLGRLRTVVWLCPRCHHVVGEAVESAQTSTSEMRAGNAVCKACGGPAGAAVH
jgi:two-component system OmpR family response regulator